MGEPPTRLGELRRLLAQIDVDEAVRRRGVQQAILEAQAWHWEDRAQIFLEAAPRAYDYTGSATPEQIAELRERCLATAQACQNRAQLLRWEEHEA